MSDIGSIQITFEIAPENDRSAYENVLKSIDECNVTLEIITGIGPSGGFPEVLVKGTKENIAKFLHKVYDDLEEEIEEMMNTYKRIHYV